MRYHYYCLVLVSFVLVGVLAGTAMSADSIVALKRDAGMVVDGAIDARFLTAAVVPTTVNDTCLWGMGEAKWGNGGGMVTGSPTSANPNLYKFDFSSIPAGAIINLAQLQLYHTGGNGGQGQGGVALVLTHDWIEGTGVGGYGAYPGAAGGATYAHPQGHNTGPYQDTDGGTTGPQGSWGPNSDSYFDFAVDCGAVTDPISAPSGTAYSVFTVTADVQAWVSGTVPNYGWGEQLGYWDVQMSEAGSDFQPVLFVDYTTSAAPKYIHAHDGDANNDGKCDVVDLGVLAKNYDSKGLATSSVDPYVAGSWQLGDFSNDGNVDVVDLGVLAKNYDWAGSPAVPTPEPMSLSLLSVGGLALIRRRK